MIKIDGQEVKVTRFPDGTFKFDYTNNKTVKKVVMRAGTGRPVVKIGVPHYRVEWVYENMEELFLLQSLNYFLGEKTWELVMPYIPNARMDKTASTDEGFMLKYFAAELNRLNFDVVYVDDPHSPVAAQLIDNLIEREDELAGYYVSVLEDEQPDIIVFPDKGARDRYSNMSVFNGYDIIHANKVRNQKTGDIVSFELVGDVEAGAKALIVDDICSKGGTFYHTALKLNEKGVNNISLSVTHLEDTVKQGHLLKDNSPIKDIHCKNKIGEWN